MRIVPVKLTVALAAVLVAAVLAGCGGGTQTDGIRVVASFYPFAYVAERVGGVHVHVDNLTSPGVEPHDVELTPKQVGSVQTAGLVIYERHFQTAVDDAVDLADRPAGGLIDVAKLVRLHRVQAGAHSDGDLDPHTWLDPHTMIAVTHAVEARLSGADPAHAQAYAANAARLEGELTRLDADFATGLASCRTRTIVTSHAAFQYLAARYRLTQVPIAGIDPTNEPAPSQLAAISSLVRRNHITTIFTEELVSPAIADTVARETGARTATLDPIEGLGDHTRHETYLTLMHRNLDALRKAGSCS
jgi:zinc transport system substrate-binding protein